MDGRDLAVPDHPGEPPWKLCQELAPQDITVEWALQIAHNDGAVRPSSLTYGPRWQYVEGSILRRLRGYRRGPMATCRGHCSWPGEKGLLSPRPSAAPVAQISSAESQPVVFWPAKGRGKELISAANVVLQPVHKGGARAHPSQSRCAAQHLAQISTLSVSVQSLS